MCKYMTVSTPFLPWETTKSAFRTSVNVAVLGSSSGKVCLARLASPCYAGSSCVLPSASPQQCLCMHGAFASEETRVRKPKQENEG